MQELIKSNAKNSTSDYMGVSKNGEQWRARIMFEGSHVSLGNFDTCEEAAQVYARSKKYLEKKKKSNKEDGTAKETKKKVGRGGNQPNKKEGGTATPQDDDIIVGNTRLLNPKVYSDSLSKAITSKREEYADAEGEAAKKAVAKGCIESLGDVRVLEKYYHDSSYTVLNEHESIAYVQRIFRYREMSKRAAAKKDREKENKRRRERHAKNPEPQRRKDREYHAKNKDNINERRRKRRRVERAQESTSTAEIMRQRSEEYETSMAKGDNIEASDLLDPPLVVVPGKDKNDRPLVHYKTPTVDDPYKVNDANVLTRDGIGKGRKWFKPAQNHVSPVPPENMELTDGELMIKPNRLVSEQKRKDCGLLMYELAGHTLHNKWYAGIGVKLSIKFHLRHWKCFCYKKGDVLYIYNYYSTNKVYDSCFQCKVKSGNINPACALLSGSIIMGTPCSVVKATLGKDLLTLSDTKFEFIRINRDMKTVVSLPLNDDSLIVTPYEVTTKPSKEIASGAVSWDASRESKDDEELTEEEAWERYDREHTDAYYNQS